MFRLKRLIGGSVLVFILAGAAPAQENSAPAASRDAVAAAPVVTAAATAKRVRFVSPGTVVQVRLEVYNETGQKVFDTELRGGNVLDWYLQNGAGERLPSGSYATVLTIKGLSGRLSQRVGSVTVNDEKTAIGATGASAFSLAQQQTIGPVEGNAAFAVLQESEAEAMTAVTHDGQDGQVTSTRGALTFRTGDLFAGKDKEQMRLTEAGDLGIGTDKPQARLDVAGTIRTSEGIEFANADGTKVTRLTTTATGGLQQMLADGTVVPNATGTGTQNFISKWIDNAGTLGDSNIFESAAGRVGLGTTNPGAKFHVVGTQGSVGAGTFQLDGATLFNNWTAAYPAFEVLNTNPTNNNISLFQFSDAPSGAAHAGIGAVATSHANKFGDLFFFTKQSDGYQMRMGIFGGTVGIGTTTPTAGIKLHVNGGASLVTPGNGYEIAFGTPNGDTGMSLIRPAGLGSPGRADVRFNGSTLSLLAGIGTTAPCCGIVVNTAGNVGIGTPTPTSKLDIAAQDGLAITGFQPFMTFRDTNNANKLSRLQSADGGFLFYPNDFVGGTPTMALRNSGNVGIGTTGPPTRLAISGGPTWTSASWAGSLSLGNASALGWEANASGQRFGIGQTNGGLYFFRTNSAFGTTGSQANYDLQITDTGNLMQPRDKGGLVKAMVYVDANGNIVRCYNSRRLDGGAGLPPAGTSGCGFTTNRFGQGYYRIEFGFQVNDRFYSATPLYATTVSIGVNFLFNPSVPTELQIITFITDVDHSGSPADNGFMLIIY